MPISRRKAIALTAGAALSAVQSAPPAGAGQQLRIGGTGSATALLDLLAREFRKRSPAASFSVVPGLGSGGGILAVRDNALDLAVSARPLAGAEAADLVGSPWARSPFVFATSHGQPEAHTIAQLAAKYADARAQWADGSPVTVILRPRTESDTRLVARLFPEVARAIETARKRPDVPVAVTDIDNAAMAERTSGSLATISLTQIRLERRKLRAVPVAGIEPSLGSLLSGAYPFGRNLYLVHGKEPSTGLAAFLAFLRSPEAEQLLRAGDALPLPPA